LKLLHFIQTSPRSRYLNAIADHADRSRFELTVGSLAPAGQLQEDMSQRGLPVFSLGCARRGEYPAAILRLASRLREERFDIVQTHLFDASFVGLTAARLARVPLAILNNHHSAEVVAQRKPRVMWIDRIMSRYLAHRVIAPSPYMRDVLVRETRVPAERIAVIPYGLDLRQLRPSEGARERLRAELGLENRIVFGAVGRLHWVKNYPGLLEAFASAAGDRNDVSLLVAGDGPDRSRIEKAAIDLGLEGRVRLLGFRPDVTDLLSAIDVLVHASFVECAVQVVSEAFAVGTPVVSTAVGGASELIDPGVNGYLVSPGDTGGMKAALLAMLGRRSDWKGMGAEGRRRVERNAAERIQPLYETQYLEWLSERERMPRAA
jgi:glycosyltransferase involved in cell wall biosynthesis